MINKAKVKKYLNDYVNEFDTIFNGYRERYKWEAIKHFQDNWDINSPNFVEMLKESLRKTDNLLSSNNCYPKKMILMYAEIDPEYIRGIFAHLFDESIDLGERVTHFIQGMDEFQKEHERKKAHYHKANAISTYLWLRYPDKYYIFKFEEYNNVSSVLEDETARTEFKRGRQVSNINNGYKMYEEIRDLIRQDQKLISIMKEHLDETCYPDENCITLTVDFGFFLHKYKKGDGDMPEYKPELNQILYGPPGTGKTYNTVVKAMSIIDGWDYKANYNKVADKYTKKDGSLVSYDVLKEEFNALKNDGQIEFITFHQSYSYEEFVEGIKPCIDKWGKDNKQDVSYVGQDGIFKEICSRAEKNLYRKKDNSVIPEIPFEDVLEYCKEEYPEGSTIQYSSKGALKNISYDKEQLKYNFGEQTGDRYIDLVKIKELINNNRIYKNSTEFNEDYKRDVGLQAYHHGFYKELLKFKKILEEERQSIIENSEDFVIDEKAKKYVLIIDEINRGNISKIFGELITLIEPDKRLGEEHSMTVTLPYSQKKGFGVPKNLYIVGTMNTSDRSIASVDIALRRRFKFEEMMPNSEIVADFKCGFQTIFEALNRRISILLDRDHQIGHSYFVKTKYNDGKENNNIKTLKKLWFDSIMPLLNEYFYGDWTKLQAVLGPVPEKSDDKSFIKKIILSKDLPSFVTDACSYEDAFDFVKIDELPEDEDFISALKNAGYIK